MLPRMARMVTMYHPELDATSVVTEGAFYGKGGFRDRGWVLHEPGPTETAEEPPAAEEPAEEPEEE